AHPCRLFHQLTLAASHLPLLHVKVVLETDANVAAHRDRRRDERPLVEADADDLPVRSRWQAVDLVDQVTSRTGNAAQHSHDEAELQRGFEHAHVDERPRVADVARVEALHLGPHAGGVHGLEEELDVMKRVGEDVIVIEDLPLLGVDRVIHRAHVQRGHLWLEVANVGDALLRRDADGTGREVADRVGSRCDLCIVLRQTRGLPSAGSTTCAIIAPLAARSVLSCARIASNIRERVSSWLSEASICLLKMMFTAPSGPMTEISANGHATSTSGW